MLHAHADGSDAKVTGTAEKHREGYREDVAEALREASHGGRRWRRGSGWRKPALLQPATPSRLADRYSRPSFRFSKAAMEIAPLAEVGDRGVARACEPEPWSGRQRDLGRKICWGSGIGSRPHARAKDGLEQSLRLAAWGKWWMQRATREAASRGSSVQAVAAASGASGVAVLSAART